MKHPRDTLQSNHKGFFPRWLGPPLECSIELVGAGSDVVVDDSIDGTPAFMAGDREVCKDVGGGD